ncbi:DUF4349 domain-containing protein [Mucilaginibacter sp. RS28]|uniref:DUF4349 domain-containing protein n=1 Tax=Mucilaginibacter straminoryzae TaxID=2932774 RepID=A0A9X1X3A7_9SPHI|nr:DUF4349 domain-containing protein [Mucilaginibacter straminoryzae]MCJ8210382.1 DUF4349 domain-containing protein [Mucilaginibacter straminoryzae]
MKTRQLLAIAASLLLLGACKGKYEPINNDNDHLASSADSAASSATEPKLVKTASINFKVRNVEQTSMQLTALTTLYQGMVMHHHVSSSIENTRDTRVSNDSVMRVSAIRTVAELEVKVPSVKLNQFMDEVSKMGLYVAERKMDIDDKSLDYLAAQMKLNSRNQIISQQKKGRIVIRDPGAVVNLKDDMIDQQITNMKIDEAVKYSIVDLSFYQSNHINKEIIANDDPANYTSPFFTRLKVAFSNGFMIFQSVVLAIANLWLLIVCAFALYFGIAYYRKRKRTATLNTANI